MKILKIVDYCLKVAGHHGWEIQQNVVLGTGKPRGRTYLNTQAEWRVIVCRRAMLQKEPH